MRESCQVLRSSLVGITAKQSLLLLTALFSWHLRVRETLPLQGALMLGPVP